MSDTIELDATGLVKGIADPVSVNNYNKAELIIQKDLKLQLKFQEEGQLIRKAKSTYAETPTGFKALRFCLRTHNAMTAGAYSAPQVGDYLVGNYASLPEHEKWFGSGGTMITSLASLSRDILEVALPGAHEEIRKCYGLALVEANALFVDALTSIIFTYAPGLSGKMDEASVTDGVMENVKKMKGETDKYSKLVMAVMINFIQNVKHDGNLIDEMPAFKYTRNNIRAILGNHKKADGQDQDIKDQLTFDGWDKQNQHQKKRGEIHHMFATMALALVINNTLYKNVVEVQRISSANPTAANHDASYTGLNIMTDDIASLQNLLRQVKEDIDMICDQHCDNSWAMVKKSANEGLIKKLYKVLKMKNIDPGLFSIPDFDYSTCGRLPKNKEPAALGPYMKINRSDLVLMIHPKTASLLENYAVNNIFNNLTLLKDMGVKIMKKAYIPQDQITVFHKDFINAHVVFENETEEEHKNARLGTKQMFTHFAIGMGPTICFTKKLKAKS